MAGLPSSQPIHHPFIGQPKLYIPSTINTGVIDVNEFFIVEATILCTETPVLYTVSRDAAGFSNPGGLAVMWWA